MSSTQRPPFCPPPLPGTDEDHPAPRRTNVVPLRHLRAEACPVSDQDDNEPAWRKAFVLGDGTRTTRTPNRIMHPNDRHDDKPSLGAGLKVAVPLADDEPADVIMLETASSEGFVAAAVRSQIAELRSKFVSTTPDITERLTALARKEAALSGGGTTITAEDSPQALRPTATALADQDKHPMITGDGDDAEDTAQAFIIEAPIVSFAWPRMSCLIACVTLSRPADAAPALSGAEDEIREAVTAFPDSGEGDPVPPAAMASGIIEDAAAPTAAPVLLRPEEQDIPDDVDFGYVALYEGFPSVASESGVRAQAEVSNTAEASIQPIVTTAPAAFRVENASGIVAETAAGRAHVPEKAPLPGSAKILDLPKVAPSTWGYPAADPAAAEAWSYQKPDINYLAEPPERDGPALTEDILEETCLLYTSPSPRD